MAAVRFFIPEAGASGVIIASGRSCAGFTLYLEGGTPVYEYNFFGRARYKVEAPDALAAGSHTILLDFVQDPIMDNPVAGGTVTISVNGSEAATGKILQGVPLGFSTTETMDIGADLGAVVSLNYEERAPFEFTGTIERVVIEIP